MWIVRLALRRPYTFVVMAVLIAILGTAAIVSMPVDIFPYIDIPVVSVVWSYGGLSAEEMEKRMVTIFERAMTTTVNDIEHIESQSYGGYSVTRVYFQPNAKVEVGLSQVTAIAQTLLKIFPPGTTPPSIIKYDASSVPIIQLGLESKTLSEQELFDLGQNFIRTQLATIQGAAVPLPYGGKFRQVMVDLDPSQLFAKGLSPVDVSNALANQNLILPAGDAKIGAIDYTVRLNSSPRVLDELNDLPIKVVNGAPVYIRDVGQARDGYSVQTAIVRTNGTRGALLTVLRSGKASTLDVVNKVKSAMPKILAGITPELHVRELFDQSLFVRAAINGVVREAITAAFLTGLMILVFLGSWRSTVIVCISIPLSILVSLICLSLLGATVNVMTLGGLALAVGILVDDATVEIENTHRNMAMKKPLVRAVLDGAMQIAAPAFVSTLSICIVFVPVLLLTGAAKYLFTPLAGAVVFAMMASYFLSRTIIPTMVHYMLRSEVKLYAQGKHGETSGGTGIIWKVHYVFNHRFEQMRAAYVSLLHWCLDHRAPVIVSFGLFVAASLCLAPLIGRDFFPTVDSGQMRLHARAPSGTRLEQTEVVFANIESEIRKVIPPREIDTIIDNIGIPNGGFNLAFGDNPTLGVADGDILISLNQEEHGSTAEYTDKLRKHLHEAFPDVVFFFEAANITNQILNFGLPAPIDVQVVGRNAAANYQIAQNLRQKIAAIPGAADVHIHQVVDWPEIDVNVDRNKAGQVGLTQKDVSNSLLVSLASSGQVAPTQWLDWKTGVSYFVSVQTPQYRMNSLDSLMRTPITSGVRIQFEYAYFAGGSGQCRKCFRGGQPQPDIRGVRQSGGRADRTAVTSQPGGRGALRESGNCQPLQRAACVRRLRQRGSQRPGFGGRRGEPDREPGLRQTAARHHAGCARPDQHHAKLLLPAGPGHDLRGGAGLPADGRQFPIVAGSLHHSDGAARCARRHRVDSVSDPDHLQRAVADGRHYVHWRRYGQQYSDGGVRQRSARGRHGRPRRRPLGRPHADPPGDHDRQRDDHRYAAHGPRFRRGRRAERAARTRGHRRPDSGHNHYAFCGSIGI